MDTLPLEGEQCLANCTCAIDYNFTFALRCGISILDDILNGDVNLYTCIGKEYLTTEDIPSHFGTMSELIHGSVSLK
jgi:hypothetical protein